MNFMANQLELNPEFLRAFQLLEYSKEHVFITGKAGTGKSTLLQYFREHTTKNVAILAPTGVAAVNILGQTVHSFFRFKPDITPERIAQIRLRREDRELFEALDAVLIDEISMLRADVLDCIDCFLRRFGKNHKKPFGGIQMMMIGDLFQLPPVVSREERGVFKDVYLSPYFFDAKVFQNIPLLEYIDLEKIYRQQDDSFIALLNAIRHDQLTNECLKRLNERCRPDFYPEEDDFYVYLTTTNAIADRINQQQLQRLAGEGFCFQGRVEGKFEDRNLPTKEILELKSGAQVMLLNNEASGQWVNGSIGKVVSVAEDLSSTDIVEIELEDGRIVEVGPFTWEMFRFHFNEETQRLESNSIGSFMQYPLRLAWAVTIHKSQGKTFSKVILDIGQGAFAHGQTYVALSRCTSLEGIVLKRPIQQTDIIVDPRVIQFMEGLDQRVLRQ